MRPAGHCFIYHSIYVNVSYMNNEISAKSGKSMESDPIDFVVAPSAIRPSYIIGQ